MASCCSKPPVKEKKAGSQIILRLSSVVSDEETQLQSEMAAAGCSGHATDPDTVARYRRFNFLRQFGLPRYCRSLGALTHRSLLVEVSVEEARAMVDAFAPDGAWYM